MKNLVYVNRKIQCVLFSLSVALLPAESWQADLNEQLWQMKILHFLHLYVLHVWLLPDCLFFSPLCAIEPHCCPTNIKNTLNCWIRVCDHRPELQSAVVIKRMWRMKKKKWWVILCGLTLRHLNATFPKLLPTYSQQRQQKSSSFCTPSYRVFHFHPAI